MLLLALSALIVVAAGCADRPTQRSVESGYPAPPRIIPREQWGWRAGEGTLSPHQINRITIHHGGEEFSPETDPLKYLPKFQSWCREEKKWIDIPYHFMIDLQGRIYEARPINVPGDTNTGYDVRGHALICVLGNYENQILSNDQLSSVINLATFLARTFSVPVDSIRGHKDYTETLCPGKDLYRYLQDGTIRDGVTRMLGDH